MRLGLRLEGGSIRSFGCGFGTLKMMLGLFRKSTGIDLAFGCRAVGLLESTAYAMSHVVACAKVQVCGSLAVGTLGQEGRAVES